MDKPADRKAKAGRQRRNTKSKIIQKNRTSAENISWKIKGDLHERRK
jgi:hypothetical protein